MKKRIFQAGNYGEKGTYTVDLLQSWVDKEFSFPIVAGHIGDYLNNGYPLTSIPKAGVAKCVGVDEQGYLVADVEYNEFGSSMTETGAYDNYSLGMDVFKNPNHLALLGYMPPHIDTLDKAFAEFSSFGQGELTYIEFNEGGEMTIAELLAALDGLSAADKLSLALAAMNGLDVTQVDVAPLLTKAWELDDQQWYINRLTAEGYTVGKAAEFSKDTVEGFAKLLGFTLKEVEQPKALTREEWEAQYVAEFSRKQEAKEYTEKFVTLFPPVMKPFAEFCAGEAFNETNYPKLIEFSTEKKVSMADYIKETVKTGGPFAHLFKEFSKGIIPEDGEPVVDKVDPFEAGARAAKI